MGVFWFTTEFYMYSSECHHREQYNIIKKKKKKKKKKMFEVLQTKCLKNWILSDLGLFTNRYFRSVGQLA